jgi:transcription termination/antitermination protein NusG
MSSGSQVEWVAIHTQSRYEKIVKEQLASRGVECFLPTLQKTSVWKYRSKEVQWSLFPGYCFARLSADQKPSVLKIVGVVDVMANDAQSHSISEDEIEQLKRIAASGRSYAACSYREEGTAVKVIRGPLQGIRGRILGNEDCRLILPITAIRKAAMVGIALEEICVIANTSRSMLEQLQC